MDNSDFTPLKRYDNNFGINSKSQVINFKTGNILSPYIGIDLYQHLIVCYQGRKDRVRVHRLMAEAFFNNASLIDHIDGNKSNNNLDNLRPCSYQENNRKAYAEQTNLQHKWGNSIPIIVENKTTGEKTSLSSMRQAENFTKIDRHRIKTFLEGTRNNLTDFNFYYEK